MRMRPDQVPEPSQPSRSLGLGIPGAAGEAVPAPKMPAPVAKKPAPVAKKPAPVAKKPAPVAKKPGLVDMPGPVEMPGPVRMPGLVDVASAPGTRPRISHDIQDAWNIRLQHVNNSQPGANAKHPQPGQADTPSSLSSCRTR